MSENKDIASLLALAAVPGIGPNKMRSLVTFFGSAIAAMSASEKHLIQVPGIDLKTAQRIRAFNGADFVNQQMDALAKSNACVLSFWDKEYPELLKRIYDPPPLLFVNGSLTEVERLPLAIVGTRRPSTYGKIVTEKLTEELVALGVTIVSGLAYGIDTIAHVAALNRGGQTIGVLGSGVDVIYPAENRKTAARMAKSGAVISEYPWGPNRTAVIFHAGIELFAV